MYKINKAQAATETLIVVAMALIVFLAIFTYNQQNISNVATDFEVVKTRTALDSISQAVELVHQQGDGAKTIVYINLPRSLKWISIDNQSIIMILYGQTSDITLHHSFDFGLNGTIEILEGNQWVTIKSLGNTVLIGNASITLAAFCGNSIIESGEQCDNIQLNGQTCVTQGYDFGSLACTGLCTFDYLGCEDYICGNNIVEGLEVCDNTNLTGQTCISQGYTSGTLYCLSDCTAYNYSACISVDTQPPAWITNLQNQSQGRNWIYWTWINPVNADFNTSILYLNGINIINTSNNFYNATGLIPNQFYTLTVHTMDHSGNINNSDVSSTVRTYAQPYWQTIFFDNFNRANSGTLGTATLGGSWTETGGLWRILSNQANANNCDPPGDQITTSTINLLGKSLANLTFNWQYTGLDSNECLSLDLNDGSGWIDEVWIRCSTGLNQNAAGTEVLDLTSYILLSSTVQLRYDCLNSVATENVYLDDVNVTAYGS